MDFVDVLKPQAWDVLLIGMEWSTGSNEVVLFNVPPDGRPCNASCFGILVNVGGSKQPEIVCRALKPCITEKGFDPTNIFNAAKDIDKEKDLSKWTMGRDHLAAKLAARLPLLANTGNISLWFAAQKFCFTMEVEHAFQKNLALAHRLFKEVAGHHPPAEYDCRELNGAMVKCSMYGRLVFEISVEAWGGFDFKAWNDDNLPNCEMRCPNFSTADLIKVYWDNQVCFEVTNHQIA